VQSSESGIPPLSSRQQLHLAPFTFLRRISNSISSRRALTGDFRSSGSSVMSPSGTCQRSHASPGSV
jgi:hypothetical protein